MIGDLVEAVPREGEHEDQRLRASAPESVSGGGRDIDRAAGSDLTRVVVDLHAPPAADDEVRLLGRVVMEQEPSAGWDLRQARDEPTAFGAFAGDKELPAHRALGGDARLAPTFPLKIGLVDDDGFRRAHGTPRSAAKPRGCEPVTILRDQLHQGDRDAHNPGGHDPPGISILPVPDGTVIHPTAAAPVLHAQHEQQAAALQEQLQQWRGSEPAPAGHPTAVARARARRLWPESLVTLNGMPRSSIRARKMSSSSTCVPLRRERGYGVH